MPRWDFSCLKCGTFEGDVWHTRCEPDEVAPDCPTCGKKMEILLTSLRQKLKFFNPFVSRNIHPKGEPITITNSGDLRRMETEFGVKQVDHDMRPDESGKLERHSEGTPKQYFDEGR